ncbi:MAG: TIGR02452 family protein [Proteobacteria bacterium]|nr:TIGR02452 family protein [Pseudomonadota bacterium]
MRKYFFYLMVTAVLSLSSVKAQFGPFGSVEEIASEQKKLQTRLKSPSNVRVADLITEESTLLDTVLRIASDSSDEDKDLRTMPILKQYLRTHLERLTAEEDTSSGASKVKDQPVVFLQDWDKLGLLKTNKMNVHPGQKLTVTCTFNEIQKRTHISFLNSKQNGYYDGGVVVEPGMRRISFTSIVPNEETRTWLVIRDPAFDGVTQLPLGVRVNDVFVNVEEEPPFTILPDWVDLGLLKTNQVDSQPGQKLTVTCTFDEVTQPTALSFLNSNQKGYYEGGVTVSPGQKSVTFSSVVPPEETRTWLIIRNPAFDGVTKLPLGVRINNVLLDVQKDIESHQITGRSGSSWFSTRVGLGSRGFADSYRESIEALELGEYPLRDGQMVVINPAQVKQMQRNTKFYADAETLDRSMPIARHKTVIQVLNKGTLETMLDSIAMGENPVALNFASQTSPNGGVGADNGGAQEEKISHLTNYYQSLNPKDNPYLQTTLPVYNLGEFGTVYSPDVLLIRQKENDRFFFIPPVKGLNFIACAAYNLNSPSSPREGAYLTGMTHKIRNVLRTAMIHGHSTVILGAWGCGAFANRPDVVALLFQGVLAEPEFLGAFKKVYFSIVGYEPNLTAFKKVFEH